MITVASNETQFDLGEAGRLRIARFEFTLRGANDLVLPPFAGILLRSVLGAALRRVSCGLRHLSCGKCPARHACPYGYLFEGFRPPQAEAMKKANRVPHPFALTVDSQRDGGKLCFSTTLFGRGIDFFPHLVLAVQQMGEMGLGRNRAHFVLESVRDARGKELLRNGGLDLTFETVTLAEVARDDMSWARELELSFLSPVRLKAAGRLVRCAPTFDIVVESLLRRLSTLAHFHQGLRVTWERGEIVARCAGVKTVCGSVYWTEFDRYSARQRRQLKMGGLLGSVAFAGEDLAYFVPLLRAGEWIQLGKGTSFGFGVYIVRREAGL